MYKIGDKVICPHKPLKRETNRFPGWDSRMDQLIGVEGEITHVDTGFPTVYEVNFEKTTNRDLDFWYYLEEWLEPAIDRQSFTVSTDNKKIVTVVDIDTGISGEAKCHPDDEFNLITGIVMAYERMTEKLKDTYYTGPVFCTRNEIQGFVKGYIYHIFHGELMDNDGYVYKKIKDIDDYFGDGIFIPFEGIEN